MDRTPRLNGASARGQVPDLGMSVLDVPEGSGAAAGGVSIAVNDGQPAIAFTPVASAQPEVSATQLAVNNNSKLSRSSGILPLDRSFRRFPLGR